MQRKLLFYIFLLVLIVPNVCLSVLEPMGFTAAFANVLLPLGVYLIMMSISPKIGRTIWLMFPFVFLGAFQIVLLSLYGRSVIAVDMFLNVATTNSAEVSELLGSMVPILGIIAVMYLPPLICAIIFIKRKLYLARGFLKVNRWVGYGIAVIGMVFMVCSYIFSSNYAIKRDLYPVNALYNVYLACDRTVRTGNYYVTSDGYKYNSIPTHPSEEREVYILIIGETSRADNWNILGYERNTNPLLSQRDDILVSGRAMSESNTTHKSVPMLLSPVDATDFDKEIYKTKSLITAFKEAGYATAFISNQRYNHSFIDFFGEESDTTIFVREQTDDSSFMNPTQFSDMDLLPIVDMVLAQNNRKQLIVLHTYGSHFNYRDRYDAKYAHFKPDDYSEAMKSEREKLINAYDNTIVATDFLIMSCIKKLESLEDTSAGLLYTSDHGEDIFDNGSSRFLHASPLPTYYQLHVPMLAWLSEEYISRYNDAYEAAKKNFAANISTSRSFCPTAINLAGIKTDKLDIRASLMSPEYEPRKIALYLSDHNTPVRLDEIIIDK